MVLGKIQYIEKSWKRAHDWINQTGQGVKEDDPDNFEEAVLKYCRLYYILLDVMYSRSSSNALATTDDLLHGDDDVSECSDMSGIRSDISGADFVEVREAKRKISPHCNKKQGKGGKFTSGLIWLQESSWKILKQKQQASFRQQNIRK